MKALWSRLRRCAVVVLVSCAALMGPVGPAGAHAFLASSFPADGAVVDTSPRQLQLRFSESIELAATHIDVVGRDGHSLRPSDIHLVATEGNAAGRTAAGPVLLVVTLPALSPDAYRVSWQTVSSDDLHRTSGVFVFGLQHAATAAGLHEPNPALPESGLRWLLFLGLAMALGATLLTALYRPAWDGPFADTALRRCRALAVVGAFGAVVVSGVLLAQQMSVSGESLRQLLSGSYGARWLVREAGLGGLLAVMCARARSGASLGRTSAQLLRWATAVAAVTAAAGSALLGHSATGVMASPTRIAADAAHLLAAAVWSGTVLAVAVVVVPRLRTSGGEAVAARAALRRFLIPAVVCVSVMVVTGLYLASGVIGSVDALLLTTYGRLLLAKLAVIVVAGVLAMANSAALHPEGAFALRRAVGLHRAGRVHRAPERSRFLVPEALAAAVVLALSALLVSGQPAREPQLVHYADERIVPVSDGAAADLQETLEVRPNRPGANVVLVGVFDTRRPSPGVVRGVDVVLADPTGGGTPLVLTPLGDGRWSVPATLTASGTSFVRVRVHRQGLADAVASYRWVVGGAPQQTHDAVVSTEPLAVPLQVAAGGLAGIGVVLTATFLITRRKRTRRGIAAAQDSLSARSSNERVTNGA